MTPELTVLALSALVQVAQILTGNMFMTRDMGPKWNMGPRDEPATFAPLTGRLRRAVSNHFEAMALFTIAVVVVTLSGSASVLTAACAWIYLAARVLYVPAYAFGWSPWRSLIFGIGLTATLVMLVAALLGGSR